MSWREQYQPGSFRGASFRTEGHERSGGRRIATFEFPGRDAPLTEDLGRRARGFSIDCHVIGADYRAGRDALSDALEAPGPGLLIHPWHGQMMVVVQEFTAAETTEEGGFCSFRISFAEAGQPVSAPLATPSGQLAAIAADAQHAASPAIFAQRFSIQGAADFVEASAASLISGMVEVSQLAAGLQGGIGPALRAFDAGLRYLPANLSGLLRAPVNLAHSLIGLVTAVSLLGSGSRTRIAALSQMIDWQPVSPIFPERTRSRILEAANRDALLWLFRSAAGAELARAAAAAPFVSYDEAISTRDAAAARLDRLALAAADRSDDLAAERFDQLRRAMVRDITTRGASLARVYALQLAQTEPALAIANRVYGAGGVAARAAEIASRNRLAHPGFVPALRPLELLTLTSASLAA